MQTWVRWYPIAEERECGPSLVVHAVRDARRAAAGIHRYLDAAASDPITKISAAVSKN